MLINFAVMVYVYDVKNFIVSYPYYPKKARQMK